MIHTQAMAANQSPSVSWEEGLIDNLASWWVTGSIVALAMAYAVCRHALACLPCHRAHS